MEMNVKKRSVRRLAKGKKRRVVTNIDIVRHLVAQDFSPTGRTLDSAPVEHPILVTPTSDQQEILLALKRSAMLTAVRPLVARHLSEPLGPIAHGYDLSIPMNYFRPVGQPLAFDEADHAPLTAEQISTLVDGLASTVRPGHISYDYSEPENQPDKGQFNGCCNRQSCQQPPARYYNRSTKLYYCAACAAMLNRANPDAGDVIRGLQPGDPLCVYVDTPVKGS